MGYYIYLDDIRENASWYNTHLNRNEWIPYVCRTAQEVIELIIHLGTEAQYILDLDYDLDCDDDEEEVENGYDVCQWIVNQQIHVVGFHIHSANSLGSERMRNLLVNYGTPEV